jgi:1,4-dihydroxy-2-naphthoate octaprenyltransferase
MALIVSIWNFLREIRAPYFAAIALPILLGSAVAYAKQGTLDIGLFVMSLLAGSFLQAGTTMTNDFFDSQRTGEQDLLWALVPPQQVLQGALAFFVVGSMVGIYVALVSGPLVLLLGVIGIASAYAYSGPPFNLSGTGIGEGLAGMNLGLLTTLGAYYVQLHRLDWIVVWVALPVGLLMSAVLILNGFQPAKLAVNKSWWATLGAERAALAYALPAFLAYALLIVAVATEELPQVTLLGLLGMPLSAMTIVSTQLGDRLIKNSFSLAIVSAIGAHLSTTALLALAFILERFFQH